MFKEARLIASLTIFLSLNAIATSYVPVEANSFLDGADIVARVRVTSTEFVEVKYKDRDIRCVTTKNKADVVDLIKGDARKVEFYLVENYLTLNSEYLVFLIRYDPGSPKSKKSNSLLPVSEEQMQKDACSVLPSGHVADWQSTSKFVQRCSLQRCLPYIIPGYRTFVPDEAGVEYQDVRINTLQVNGKVVEENAWGAGADIPYPDDYIGYYGAYDWAGFKKYLIDSMKNSNKSK